MKSLTNQSHVIAAVLVACFTALSAAAQDEQAVRTAAFERAEPNSKEQSVRFSRRPARMGDKVEQTLSMEVRMATSIRKGNELGEKEHSKIRNQQQRTITATDITDGRTSAVRVHYLTATKEMTGIANETTDQPVSGKTYLCRRDPGSGGDDGKLVVTDDQGTLPSLEEYEIVASNMDMVGRPNPLAEFLAGRTMKTGQTIKLPLQIANQVFNLGEQFGDVSRFDLTVENVQSSGGTQCAVFNAKVEASSTGSSQVGLQVEGPLVVEADTCRAVKVNLAGPIGMSETRGSYSTAYQIIGTGQIKVSIDSNYHDAKR
jgi:hypothetical protein